MKKGTFAFWSLFGAAAIVRVFLSFDQSAPDAAGCLKHSLKGIGIVADDPSQTATGQVFNVDVERLIVSGDLIANRASTNSSSSPATTTALQSNVLNGQICAENIRIQIKTKFYPRFSYGDEIEFSGNLSKPFNFSSDNGRTFDYAGYLAKDDVYYLMKSAIVVLATSTTNGSSITSTLYAIKRGFVDNLESALGDPEAALAGGLVVGDKAALGKDLLNDFRIVGLIHIVVLSGFNITIVGIALRRMLSRLPRVWGIAIGGIGIALFGILVGGGATVIRSCFMAGIALIADLIRRDYSVERALAFAALIMLIANPLILMHDPSFQLSFLATIGLVLLAGPIEDRLEWMPDKFGMRGTIASCLATQTFVSPFILYMMGQISIVGVIVNILVLPFIPITMLAVFLTGALGFVWHPISIVVGWSAHLLLSYELFIVEWFAKLPFAAAYFPPFSIWWVAGFYTAFIGGFLWWKRRKKVLPISSPRSQNIDRAPTILRKGDQLIAAYYEFEKIPIGGLIRDPKGLLFVGVIPNLISMRIGVTEDTEVYVSRTALKHVIEHRGPKARQTVTAIPEAVMNPAKVADNSLKRKNSFLFLHVNTLIVCVVVEKTKTTRRCQVVSAFPIDPKKYEKIIDISGRAELPPFELSS